MTGLDTPLRSAIGARSANALAAAFEMRRVGDLLAHYPRRYVRRGALSDLSELTVGDYVTVVAEVTHSSIRNMRSRSGQIVEVTISDGRRSLPLTFFRQPWRHKQLRPGTRGLFAGQLSEFRGRVQLTHPTCELAGFGDPQDGSEALGDVGGLAADKVISVYPATAKMDSWRIALAVRTVLDMVGELPDPLPAALRVEHGLLGFAEALWRIHRPDDLDAIEEARRRLKWDEAMQLQVALARRRSEALSLPSVRRRACPGGIQAAFDAALPYRLTEGQCRVGDELAADLDAEVPMHRLLAGEVGSGKTVIALRAMLAVVDSGGQAALLAPTEVLAAQHLRSLQELLGPLGRAGQLDGALDATRVVLLTGGQGAAERRAALAAVADGSAGIVVGTHALLSEGVAFHDLGLVVVDEQHRFGVEQRAALRERGRSGTAPHLLVMTATPIPRTVAMTVFGDLETSMLTELPGGRQPIATHVVPDDQPRWRERMWEKVRDEVTAGRQAYVVCPRIEATDTDTSAQPPDSEGAAPRRRPAAAAVDVLAELADGELAGLRLGLLHGRLGAEEKDAVMRGFAAGDIDVLVATTVVEVGVDVANATVMVILDADRFGVSQLHQLRGRVGRGEHASTCLLHTAVPAQTPAGERLAAVAATNSGAELARVDLRQRGEGDVLGAAQSGVRGQLRLLRLLDDEEIVTAAREAAQRLVHDDPSLASEPALAAAVAGLLDGAAFLEKG